MRAMTVAVLVDVILRNSLAPRSTTFKVNMLDVDTSVDHVYVDAFASEMDVLVLGESAKGEFGAMADASETLR